MLQQTCLYSLHQEAGAKLVDFAGWEMPIHYGSQIAEHHQVRQHVGLFDVSHMGVLDITGARTQEFLRYALANDVAKLSADGKALYTCLLNPTGGVIDDLIVYRLRPDYYRLVLNASRREVDIAWLQQVASEFDLHFNERTDLAIIAVQGPEAIALLQSVINEQAAALDALRPFQVLIAQGLMIARTGYTGEDGVEMIMPTDQAVALWRNLTAQGAVPCGLGARDTLRLEAGLNLYGADMDETTSPLVSNLAWTVAWKDEARDFVGRAALEAQKQQGITQQLIGLVMSAGGVLRNHQTVFFPDDKTGEITSGSFSPTLGCAIALARVPTDIGDTAWVERRKQKVAVAVVKPPFVRHGKKCIEVP